MIHNIFIMGEDRQFVSKKYYDCTLINIIV